MGQVYYTSSNHSTKSEGARHTIMWRKLKKLWFISFVILVVLFKRLLHQRVFSLSLESI